MSELVSLVMPVWQTPQDWLLEAVRSCLNEDDLLLELIVVDDGCVQPVKQLLDSVKDSRVRVCRVEHGGPYAARNAGIAVAKGEWIRFVDSDDIVTSGSTTRLVNAAAGERVVTYGATLVCDDQLQPQRLITSSLEGAVDVACVLGRFDVRVVSMLFPRNVVEGAGPWDPSFRVSGDWDFVLRALETAPVRPVDVLATSYRRHSSSVTRTADVAEGEHARERIVDGYFQRHPQLRRPRLARDARVSLLIDSAGAYVHHGAYRPAAKRLARAARLRPVAAAAAAARLLPRAVKARLR